MPVNIFCCTVDDYISSQKKRLLEIRRQKSIVHNNYCILCMAEFRYRSDIKNLQCRICRSFYPYHFCGWQKSLLNKVEVSKISECKCNFVWFKYCLLYTSD